MYLKNKVITLGIVMLLLSMASVLASGEKQCVSGSAYINIISPDNYAIGQNIDNVTIQLKAGTFNFAKSKITAILYEGTNEVGTKLTNGFVNSLGQVNVDFRYSSSRSTDLSIKMIVDNGEGQIFQASKTIKVLPTLDNKLTCDVQGYVDRTVSCSWKTYDKDTGSVVSSNPIVEVKQGSTNLVYSPVGSNGIEFKSSNTGGVSVNVLVSKSGYISDTDSILVSIQSVQTTTTFNIDNKEFFSYAGFTTGVHTLELVAKDSGVPSEVSKVEATITTPSNQAIPVTFNRVSTGVFRTSFNLEEAGRTYSLDGNFVYLGTRDSIPFSYKLSTTATTTEDLGSQMNVIIIAGVVGLLMAIAFIVLAIWLKRSK
jgi:hypothetical protein